MREYLIKELQSIDGLVFNGDINNSIPSILNISLPNITGEIAMLKLDQKGICISTGSACSSGTVGISHVLKSMGVDEKRANNAIRISIGKHTTKKEIKLFIKEIKSLLIV